MTRLALALLVAAVPSLAAAAPVPEHAKGDDGRTGGMGVGTRFAGEVSRPGTDMTTAGAGAARGKPGGKADSIGSTDGRSTTPR